MVIFATLCFVSNILIMQSKNIYKILKIISLYVLIFCSGFGVFALFYLGKEKQDEDKTYQSEFKKNYKVYSLSIPEKLNFAGESVPLDLYYVRESLERELLTNTYWQSNTILMLKRASRFFPVLEKILKEQNIPEDFKYLALIESGFLNVVSPAGASGFWQFMKATGTAYGLEINDEIDERYHLEKSTIAACNYLKSAKKSCKNWTLAAAAYNAGEGGIRNVLNKQQVDNYYQLNLNAETARYVYRILALKLICENPMDYGFCLRNKDMYPEIPFTTVEVDSTINDLVSFASSYQLSIRLLKESNPWLRGYSLPNKNKKVYTIKIPDSRMIYYSKLQNNVILPDNFIESYQ